MTATDTMTAVELRDARRLIETARIAKALDERAIRDAVIWFAYLMEEADPIQGRSTGLRSRSAETPLPHEPTQSARRALERAKIDLQYMTARVQKALGVPVEQRINVVSTRRAQPEVVTSAPVKVTESQRDRIDELASQVYGSMPEMEDQLGIRVSDLDRLAATHLIRSLKG